MSELRDSRIHCTLSNDDLIDKIDNELQKMCFTRRVPLMSIPAKPNEDFDLMIAELLVRYMAALETPKHETVEELQQEIERLKGENESLKCCGNCALDTGDGLFYNKDGGCRGDSCKDNNYFSWQPLPTTPKEID